MKGLAKLCQAGREGPVQPGAEGALFISGMPWWTQAEQGRVTRTAGRHLSILTVEVASAQFRGKQEQTLGLLPSWDKPLWPIPNPQGEI